MKQPAGVPSHFRSLDVLRGLASLAIVVFHYAGFMSVGDVTLSGVERSRLPFNPYLFGLYEQGWQAVTIFFTLSGFIFFWLYAMPVAERKISASEFFLLRFSRLYPLHFATLLAVAGLQWLYGKAHPELAGVLGIAAGHERRGLLMADLDKANLLLVRSQGFHNAVNAVTRQTEYHVHSPIDQSLNQHVSSSFGHGRKVPFTLWSLQIRMRGNNALFSQWEFQKSE